MSKFNTLLVHVLDDNLREIGKPVRTKTYAQEVNYKKRMWAINHISDDVKIMDYKGITHCYVDANMADGVFHFINPRMLNLYGFTTEQEVELEEDKEDDNGNITKVKVKKKLQLPNAIAKPLDMCTRCGGRITIDARNQRDLNKRKTIDSFWGLDNSQVLLLIIMGIIAIGALGGVFYLIGQNQTLQEQLTRLTPPPVKQTTPTDFNPPTEIKQYVW